jgi:hypothetical protein
MRTRHIDRSLWTRFAEDLTSSHQGWIVDMEIFDSANDIRRESRRSPLHEMAIENRLDAGTLFLSVGDETATFSHWVNRLCNVWVEQNDEGLPEAVQLESESGERTLLRFSRIPAARQLH